MTGMGEEVYEDRSAALDALTAESERLGLYGDAPYSDHIGDATDMVENAARKAFSADWHLSGYGNSGLNADEFYGSSSVMPLSGPGFVARWNGLACAALESLGIPLTVLAALRSGEWVAVPKEPTDDMLNAAQEEMCERYSRTFFVDDDQAAYFQAMVNAAPKSPSEEV